MVRDPTRCEPTMTSPGRTFHLEQEAVESLSIQQDSLQHHGMDLPRVANVVQWVRIEEDQVGQLSWTY